MKPFKVVGRFAAERLLASGVDPGLWLVSIRDIGSSPIRGHEAVDPERKLLLDFDDVTDPRAAIHGYQRASHDDIETLVDFLRKIDDEVLINCEAGISRSPAAAIVLVASRMGAGKEKEAVSTVFASCQFCVPNQWVVKLADDILARQGRLLEALFEAMPALKTRDL